MEDSFIPCVSRAQILKERVGGEGPLAIRRASEIQIMQTPTERIFYCNVLTARIHSMFKIQLIRLDP